MATPNPAYLWLNGEFTAWDDATVHVSEIAWAGIGAVFEGIRGYWNAEQEELYVFRLREHMERLHRSMKLVRLPIDFSVDELIDATNELLKRNDCREDTYIFPLAYVHDSYNARHSSQLKTELQILTRAMPTHLNTGMTMTGRISSWRRISEDVMPPRVKNIANYRNGQLARSEAMLDGYDTAILLNTQGKVAEAPGACVMFVRDGKLITPDLTSSVLESITRDALIVMARQTLGLEVEERSVDRTELYLADEVFLCGTAAEISPVVSVDKLTVGNGETGPVTRKLERLFEDVLRGATPDYAEWRTPVGLRSAVTA
ncbi:MAG: branched-chain amino acid transaminase [Thermomicrobiales bacterium]|nr:branched-chain amino acid transaminase [Thermomicrobiales bacterium]